MSSLASLMNLAEAATGFNYGSVYDAYPDLSLSECSSRLPVFLMESQIELAEMKQRNNAQLVEATVNALQYGTRIDVAALVENVFTNLMNKIAAIFKKLKDFVKSIITKLKTKIDSARLSGQQMLARYGNSAELKKDMSDMTFNGYDFKSKENPFAPIDSYITAPRELIEKAIPGIPTLKDVKYEPGEDYGLEVVISEDELNKMNEITSEQRKLALVNELLTIDDLSSFDGWQQAVTNKIYGEKKDLKYGSDFDVASVKNQLKDTGLDSIMDHYKKLLNALNKDEADINKIANRFKDTNSANAKDGEGLPKVVSNVSSYLTSYMSIYQDAIGIISSISDMQRNYYNSKMNQAKSILAAMITYKKKDKSESAYFAEIDDFDVYV